MVLSLVTPCHEEKPFHADQKSYFYGTKEPYILLHEALRQAPLVAKERNLPLQSVEALIDQKKQIWPFSIFPTYVDVRILNRELDD